LAVFNSDVVEGYIPKQSGQIVFGSKLVGLSQTFPADGLRKERLGVGLA